MIYSVREESFSSWYTGFMSQNYISKLLMSVTELLSSTLIIS